MNQYTAIGAAVRAHDAAGNLVAQQPSGGTNRQAFFDADSRLVQWTEGSKDIRYRYDALGRRIMKQDANSSLSVLYWWDGWQTVEETNSSGTIVVQKQYVWGEGIDETLRATLPDAADIDTDSNTSELVDLYYHQNSLGSVVAVTDANGNVKEFYRYSAFGQPRVFNAAGSEVASTAVKQPFMFTGARYDFEEGSGLYQMRMRDYDPMAGRFVSRDPLGLWGDASQTGNGQGYCGHDPVNRLDPLGMDNADDVINALPSNTQSATIKLSKELERQDFYTPEEYRKLQAKHDQLVGQRTVTGSAGLNPSSPTAPATPATPAPSPATPTPPPRPSESDANAGTGAGTTSTRDQGLADALQRFQDMKQARRAGRQLRNQWEAEHREWNDLLASWARAIELSRLMLEAQTKAMLEVRALQEAWLNPQYWVCPPGGMDPFGPSTKRWYEENRELLEAERRERERRARRLRAVEEHVGRLQEQLNQAEAGYGEAQRMAAEHQRNRP